MRLEVAFTPALLPEPDGKLSSSICCG